MCVWDFVSFFEGVLGVFSCIYSVLHVYKVNFGCGHIKSLIMHGTYLELIYLMFFFVAVLVWFVCMVDFQIFKNKLVGICLRVVTVIL